MARDSQKARAMPFLQSASLDFLDALRKLTTLLNDAKFDDPTVGLRDDRRDRDGRRRQRLYVVRR